MSKTLLVMAGGTGGHVFPGLAVADRLKAQGWTIHWLGTADRMEAELVPAHGYPISFIDIQGVRGNGIKRLLAAPYRVIKSVLQARQVLKTIQPDVVLGMGGFASGPGGVAAWLSGIPLLLHEQNAAAGLTNKLLARIARRVLMAFPGAFAPNARTAVVGNPVRPEVVALPDPQLRSSSEPLRLLSSAAAWEPGCSTNRCRQRSQPPVCPSRCATSAARATGRLSRRPMPCRASRPR